MNAVSSSSLPGVSAPAQIRHRPSASEANVVSFGSGSEGFSGAGVLAPGMVREHRYRLVAAFMALDLLLASVAVFAGLQLRSLQRAAAGLETAAAGPFWESPVPMWSIGGGALFVWIMMFFRSYEPANLYRLQVWFKNLLRALLLWAVSVWSFIGLFRIEGFSPRVGIVYCLGTLATIFILSRLAGFVLLLHPSRKQAADARVIVVGWNDTVDRLRVAMRRDPGQLQEIIGCVPMPGGWLGRPPPPEVAILGDYSALPQIVSRCRANGVILTDIDCPSREIEDLISFCQREFLTFRLIPRYFPALVSGLQLENVSGVPLLGVGQLRFDRTGSRLVKRVIDIFGASVGLMLSAPIIAAFAAAVWWESPGTSVIYRQKRTSRGGRPFTIYKIRSMRPDAEKASGAVWCSAADPRRLKVGAFMRRYNIDELPQFWNVLKGDMSLVGPRPERPELIERFKDEIPNYNVRHEVKAGLTGWAQIQGLRGDTDLRQRIQADLYYLENWSVGMDFYCMAATFFNNKNAQ